MTLPDPPRTQALERYGRLCTEFYDLDKPEPPAETLERYVRYAERAEGPIHEAMCGSGRCLVPLLARGFDIDGSDASGHMLAACRARAEARGLTPLLVERPLQALNHPRQYRLILILGGSFSLLTDRSDVRAALARVHEHLVPGGTLLLEAIRFEERKADPTTGERSVRRADGSRMVFRWTDTIRGEDPVSWHHHRYEVVRDGRVEETECETLGLRVYRPGELKVLLRTAGFDVCQARDGEAPDEEHNLTLECVKPFPKTQP